jgi:aspartate carbamoyltransferase catalytic subunit
VDALIPAEMSLKSARYEHPSLMYRKPLGSIRDLSRAQIDQILDVADTLDHKEGVPGLLAGKIAYVITDEPSSRTVGSFWTAWERLGGGAFFMPDADKLSSFAKKESLFDAFRVYPKYCDVIIMRSKNSDAMRIAAQAQREERNPANIVPYLNAGTGNDEHPTQVLLEAQTYRQKLGRLCDLRIALCGDCRDSRTLRSDISAFSLYENVHFDLVSPGRLRARSDMIDLLNNPEVRSRGITYRETSDLADAVQHADIVTMTRSQDERRTKNLIAWLWSGLARHFKSDPDYLQMSLHLAGKMKPGALLAHPLPRNAELPRELDHLPQSIYLEEEIENGVRVRMSALILTLRPKWWY